MPQAGSHLHSTSQRHSVCCKLDNFFAMSATARKSAAQGRPEFKLASGASYLKNYVIPFPPCAA